MVNALKNYLKTCSTSGYTYGLPSSSGYSYYPNSGYGTSYGTGYGTGSNLGYSSGYNTGYSVNPSYNSNTCLIRYLSGSCWRLCGPFCRERGGNCPGTWTRC